MSRALSPIELPCQNLTIIELSPSLVTLTTAYKISTLVSFVCPGNCVTLTLLVDSLTNIFTFQADALVQTHLILNNVFFGFIVIFHLWQII